MVAVEHALTILNWHENLTEDEVPPQHLWEDGEGLEQWWKLVSAKRNDGMPMASRHDSDEEPDGPSQSSHSPEVAENDLARMLKG